MATITANAGAAGNWTTGGTWIGGVAPTAADDAVVNATTTSITIDAGALCRSANFTGCTGTVTMGATGTMTIGDATAGAGSVALLIPAGMTFAPNSLATFTFVSTSATLQTVAVSNTYSMCAMEFNSTSNGNYAMTLGVNNANGLFKLTKGTLHMDGVTDNAGLSHILNGFSSSNSNVRALLLGASVVNITGGTSWDISTSTNMTLTAGTSSIRSGSTIVTFQGGTSLTYYELRMTGLTLFTMGSNSTNCSFTNLSLTGTAAVTPVVIFNTNVSVTGTLTLAGNSASNRLLIQSSSIELQANINNTGATQTWSNVDFRGITLSVSYDASAITGGSGNCGGNSNITFTTPVNRYAIVAANWSSGGGGGMWAATSGGAGNATGPLPQDNVFLDANSSVGTITANMLRLGTNIDCTGYLGTLSFASNNVTMYGSLTWGSGMTIGGTNFISLEGRSSHTITSNGKTSTTSFDFQSVGGTYTLQDAFTLSAALNGITRGTFNANGFNVTATTISISSSATRTVTMGSGTWTATSTGNVWNATTTTGLTLNSGTSTIALTDTSASAKTFIGGGKTYYDLAISGGGAGTVTLTGANTFEKILIAGGTKSLVLPGSTTTTILDGNEGFGNGVNVITVTASAGSATVSLASGVFRGDYLNLTNIPSTGGAVFYAGPTTHSTDGGGNTGWIFTNAPTDPTGSVDTAYYSGPQFAAIGLF